jgi:hypothetical protein
MKRQQMSTSSPAWRNLTSNPPAASSASRLNAMLHPGMCSANWSSSITWLGPPGLAATHLAVQLSDAGTTLGPPTASTC